MSKGYILLSMYMYMLRWIEIDLSERKDSYGLWEFLC